jgi:hypothetical protein
MRNDPEGIQARKEEWEFFTKKYYEYYSPHSPYCKGHDEGAFVYKTSWWGDMFTKDDNNRVFSESEIAWANYCQRVASCGPTASAQIFAYARDVMNHRCIETNNDNITKKLADAMHTSGPNHWGSTNPWDMDEGIENVASYYGYKTSSNWTGFEVTTRGL